MLKKLIVTGVLLALVSASGIFQAEARDLIASVAIIPPHAVKGSDGQASGGFVQIVKAIDGVYTEGNIDIQLYPVARAINMLKSGRADFFIPFIPASDPPAQESPYGIVSETIMQVYFVLYSRANAPALAMDQLEKYSLETLRGAPEHFPIKIGEIDSIRQGLLKVVAGRLDGFIGEQDAADAYIRMHKIKNLRRTMYTVWNATIAVQKDEKGQEVARILSTALQRLKRSGKLQKITRTIHKPYDDWQPYQMDW